MKLSEIKSNPDNPRIIKDDKFQKLVNSIRDFPKMMELRPIVVDSENMILGGNMRLKALRELKMKEIPDTWVKRADELTEDEKKRFIITDNIGFGEWDWDVLANGLDADQLGDWGLEIPGWANGVDANNMTDEDVNTEENFDPVGLSKDEQRVVFIFKNSESAEKYLQSTGISDFSKKGQVWTVNINTQSI